MHDEPIQPAPTQAAGGKKELESLRIEPAKNGGHTVRHSYKRVAVHRKGSMSGGMGYDYPESEEFVFGPDDNEKMMAHVSKHLGLKKAAAAPEGED
jgi:hypothetical protein